MDVELNDILRASADFPNFVTIDTRCSTRRAEAKVVHYNFNLVMTFSSKFGGNHDSKQSIRHFYAVAGTTAAVVLGVESIWTNGCVCPHRDTSPHSL